MWVKKTWCLLRRTCDGRWGSWGGSQALWAWRIYWTLSSKTFVSGNSRNFLHNNCFTFSHLPLNKLFKQKYCIANIGREVKFGTLEKKTANFLHHYNNTEHSHKMSLHDTALTVPHVGVYTWIAKYMLVQMVLKWPWWISYDEKILLHSGVKFLFQLHVIAIPTYNKRKCTLLFHFVACNRL